MTLRVKIKRKLKCLYGHRLDDTLNHPLGWFFCFYYIAKINIKQRINLFLEKPNDSFYADVVFSLTITTLEKIEVTDIVFHFLTIKSIPTQSI